MNPLYGPAGLDLLSGGRPAADVVEALTSADAGRAQRQLHVLPATGPAAAWTGDHCVDWCGHLIGDDFSVAGNMLAGPQVIEATGGDKRGKQAAALRIHADEDYPQLDLRVDDHAEPIVELQRLYRTSLARYQPFMACLPGRHDPVGVIDRAEIEARIERFHATPR